MNNGLTEGQPAEPAPDEVPSGSEAQPELFEVDPTWKDHWRGMPDYSHENLQPDTTLLVHFRTTQDRQAFARLVGQTLTPTTKFIWHPKATIGKAADKVWTSAETVVPRYPVYIISKGRWDSRLTSKAFEWTGIPYHIVVEPQEYDRYAAVIDPRKILTLPFSNLGLGGIPARNFVWDHARATGAARHWIFDDNVSGFCRFQDNLKVEVDSGILHKLIEDWVDRYENLAMAAFNYDYFAPRKQGAKIKPITLNTRCYSGILLSNTLTNADGSPMQWRGRYNEDTDLSLRILKDGWCTALFNAFLMYKKPTLTMKGGNTDELYKGAEAMAAEWEAHADSCSACSRCKEGYSSQLMPCDVGRALLSKDGRWLMAESLREQHPDQTTVERKWRRWQHQVDYRRFQTNELILRPDANIPDVGADKLMTFDAMPEGWGAMGHDARNKMMGVATPKSEAPQAPVRVEVVAGGCLSALDFALRSLSLSVQEPATAPPLAAVQALGKAPASEGKSAIAAAIQPSEPEQPEAASEGEKLPDFDEVCGFCERLKVAGHRLLLEDGLVSVTNMHLMTQADRLQLSRYADGLLAPFAEAILSPAGVAAGGDSTPVSEGAADQRADEGDGGIRPSSSSTFFDSTPQERGESLASFLGSEPPRVDPNYRPDEPPALTGVNEIVLNFATDGLDWAHGNRPVGVTVGTLDGQLTRFLPFGFRGGGNLDEGAIKRWFKDNVRGKRILGANTRFEVHMAREWGGDLEEQGCTVSDVMHYAALLDDHRKRFALDVLIADYLPDEQSVQRLDERDHAGYSASEAAARERYTVQATARLRNVMWPLLDKEELQSVRQLEDDVIFAVCEMEKNGAPIDVELLERYSKECTAKYGELMMEVVEEAGFAFDGTTKAWQRLFEKCGMTLGDSRAEDVIGAVDHPLIKKAHFAGQISSLNSKTFAAYRSHIDADGILRYDINQLRGDDGGTVSGRFSIGYVQQVPNWDNHSKVFGDLWFPRRIFISKTGQYLEADAAQIEYRLGASYGGNEEILKAYKNEDPADPSTWISYHKTTWEMMKRYKPDMLYTNQKSFNFARQYGAKMVKLALMMGFINAREADEIKREKRWNDPRLAQIKEIEAAYNKINPEGDKLLDRASHLAKPACDDYCKRGDALHRQYQHRGFVKTLEGRRSRFRDSYKTYIGLNRVLQGGGADIMKKKLTELHRERKNTGLLMRMTVHDAVTGDAVDGTKEKVAAILNSQSYDLKVKILWNVGVGKTWAEAK